MTQTLFGSPSVTMALISSAAEDQQNSNWCWAAVARMAAIDFTKHRLEWPTQQSIAQTVLNQQQPSDVPQVLADVLARIPGGRFRKITKPAINKDLVKAHIQIANSTPVPANIEWKSNGNIHAVCIVGVAPGPAGTEQDDLYIVYNPLNDSGHVNNIEYANATLATNAGYLAGPTELYRAKLEEVFLKS
jgi:hypothetical protein